jgi:alkanesulfonate monooxygenase SsuD/methylene tetrahydromethanopterin reductase-like flavin-dependent oxidoreductase (luciferase family)
MKLSLMTLGDLVRDPVTGNLETPAQRHRSVVEAAAAADVAGFHGIHIGEHHGLEYIYSAPPVILAAIAARTKHLRLSTAVTLAAILDPLRAAEDYATVDALSAGRVEMVAGRGNFFTSTYTLFGRDPEDSHELFAQNIELMLRLWSGETVNWAGPHRAPIEDFTLRLAPAKVPRLWVGGGASESTTELAARLGLDLMLPSAFGNPASFRSVVDNYLARYESYGHARAPQVGACWHVNVDRSSQRARERFQPRYRAYFELMGTVIRRVNPNPPAFIDKAFDFDWLTTEGPAIVGSAEEVVDRLATVSEALKTTLNLVYLDMGGQPAAEYRDMVELVGSQVIPKLT